MPLVELFDGFSIGSNYLTQLTLDVDRDSEIVALDFDERDPNMLEMLRLAVIGPSVMDGISGSVGRRRPIFLRLRASSLDLGSIPSASTPQASCAPMTAVWDVETSCEVADAPVSVPAQFIVFQAGAQLAMKDDT